MVKIVCLGNEFVEGDTLAKEVGELLKDDFEIINVKDSFELMGALSERVDDRVQEIENLVILDVVQGLEEVCELKVGDLRVDSITSAHDFDAGFVLALFGHDSGEPKLMGEDVRIIGIPMKGDVEKIRDEVLELIL